MCTGRSEECRLLRTRGLLLNPESPSRSGAGVRLSRVGLGSREAIGVRDLLAVVPVPEARVVSPRRTSNPPSQSGAASPGMTISRSATIGET